MTLSEKEKSLDQLRRQHKLACDYRAVSPEWEIMHELVAEIEASIDRLADDIQIEYLQRELAEVLP